MLAGKLPLCERCPELWVLHCVRNQCSGGRLQVCQHGEVHFPCYLVLRAAASSSSSSSSRLAAATEVWYVAGLVCGGAAYVHLADTLNPKPSTPP
jgi:hypothetical protein